MTDSNHTLIAALLDRSGSMQSIRTDTEGGYRSFLEEQRKFPGKLKVTLAQFDHEYEIVYPVTDVADVPEFHLSPRGSTALLDAVGRFVTEVGEKLAALPEEERPGTVIAVIMTDGGENASKEWTGKQVRELVQHQQDEWNWKFVFLGANLDAVQMGADLGIARGSSLTYAANAMGTRSTFDSLTNYVGQTRSGLNAEFDEDDRTRSMGIE